jgi:predicted extracellular nuclease
LKIPTQFSRLAATSLALSIACSSVFAASINEIRIDQPSSDTDEYFELKGIPQESLDTLTYIVIGDGAGGSGTIESVTSLAGQAINGDGFFTVAQSTFSLGAADLTTSFQFENSDNVTHLLVADFTGTNGNDLDSDDDGVLDLTPWSSIVDSVALQESIGSGELLYSGTIVGPSGTFVPGHIFLCDDGWRIGEFTPIGITDTPTTENDCVGTGPIDPVVSERTIPEIQSNQVSSPFDGELVKTSGVVTADFQGTDQLRGFYLQDLTGDNNTATSDGIFVFTPDGNEVVVGDIIELTAEVDEFFGLTELKNIQSLIKTGTASITPTKVRLPETIDGQLEQYEGMLIEIDNTMTVAQNFFLGRFGQMTLSSPDDSGNTGRLFQPTNLFAANSTGAVALAASNERRKLILDDGQDISGFGDNPSPVPFIGSPPAVIRAGDSVSNLIGVLDYGRINANNPVGRDYRLQPTEAPIFTASNPRESIPQTTNGSLTVASFNVLNYFSTIDNGPDICGTGEQDCRGADTAEEFGRQEAKIVSALQAMNADIVGLIEIENNGYDEGSAIDTLVKALNTAMGTDTYNFVSPTGLANLGGDAIAVGFIYKPNTVKVVGEVATLNTGAFDQAITDGGRSRQPLAVSFEELTSGEQFTAVINHFKSKRPASSLQNNENDDQGDGQGSWNLRRTEAANDLADWLQTNPTAIDDSDVLILGDLNANAEESPLLAVQEKGYQDLIQVFNGNSGYSFVFDALSGSLDHALANESLVDQVSGTIEWHINTDEPSVIDYNTDFNPEGYYSLSPFRSSDHDPVIVGLNLFTPKVDTDLDGIDDDSDLCANTPTGSAVNSEGCSGEQLVNTHCEQFFAQNRGLYLKCVLRSVISAYRDNLLSLSQAKRIYYRAILRVFFSRFYLR